MPNRIGRTCISFRTLQLSCILKEVWFTARFDLLFKSLNVKKTINIFLAYFYFLKKLQIFLLLLVLGISNINIWPKIIAAYFTK